MKKKKFTMDNVWGIKPIFSSKKKDSDFDGVPDYKDCRPFNPLKQDDFEDELMDAWKIAEGENITCANCGKAIKEYQVHNGKCPYCGKDPYVQEDWELEDKDWVKHVDRTKGRVYEYE